MTVTLKLTRLPLLNDTIVIKQEGGHYFIAAPDSIIIDKEGLIRLLIELGKVNYISEFDLRGICHILTDYNLKKEKEDVEN